MAGTRDGASRGWAWLRQVQSTTQQLGQICTEGVEEAKRRLEENRPGIDQFVKNIGDNMQQGVKKVQEQPGFDQLVRNIGDNVQKGVKNIQENLARDPWSSPPTASELASLDLVYVNDRVIAMGFPVDKRPPPPQAGGGGGGGAAEAGSAARPGEVLPPQKQQQARVVRPGNDIDLVAALLRSRHAGHYMVWNVSEEGYDYSLFQDQVLEFRFPGHPAPPLGMLFKMCTSIESWLLADPKNVAAVHCLTGRGRTSTVLACYLAWVGELPSPSEALEHMATCKGVPMERLTIPSQRRYLSYFSSVMEGVRPRSEPLLLRRVIMNTIPTFGTRGGGIIGPGNGAAAKAEEEAVAAGGEGENGALGCCPYIQVFKGGSLIFTATYRASEGLATNSSAPGGGGEDKGESSPASAGEGGAVSDPLPWAYTSDDSISFPVDCVLQGDLLVRCRHLSPSGRRVSMFRAAFHTGYVPCGVLRLTKQQLDGACADQRFHQDFFLDLIFAPVESSVGSPSKADAADSDTRTKAGEDAQAGPEGAAAATAEDGSSAGGAAAAENSAVVRREGGLVVDAEAGEAFDSMLNRDARFWAEIAARKERRAALLKEREDARARGESPESAIDAVRAKAIKQKEAAAAAVAGLGRVRFSIDEDEFSQGANPATLSGAETVAPKKPTGGITDDDLLAQLAEAEMEQDDFLGGAGGGEGRDEGFGGSAMEAAVPPPVPPAGAAGVSPASGEDGEGSAVGGGGGSGSDSVGGGGGTGGGGAALEGKVDESPSNTAGMSGVLDFDDAEFEILGMAGETTAAGGAGSSAAAAAILGANEGKPLGGSGSGGSKPIAAAAAAASGSLEDELSQLEELEKELGIMGVVGDSPGAGGGGRGEGGGGAGGAGGGDGGSGADAGKDDDAFDMDKLDELEGYLESLAK